MYYSQPLKPPCVNTPADSKLVVNNAAKPMQKKSTTMKGKPSVIKITDASTKKTVTYRSAALDLYDFGPWTEGTEEYREVRVPGEKYSGFILDKAQNKYSITGTMEAYDSGSRLGGYNYSYNIEILPISIRLHSSTYDIIKDLEDGYFLEDYLAKNKTKAYCDNEHGCQLLSNVDAIDTSEVKSFAQLQEEKKAKAEEENRNNAIAYRNTLFKVSDNKKSWVELSTGYMLNRSQIRPSLVVINGYLSGNDLPEKTYKVEKMFGKSVEDFPVRAKYSCYPYSNVDDNLLKTYGYDPYRFELGFAVGAEDISAQLGLTNPVYPVNVYMVNNTFLSSASHVLKYGDTCCVPVIEQPFIDNQLKVEEIKHNVYEGIDTRYILNHPDYDKELTNNKCCYYLFRGKVWSVNDLLIKYIRTGIRKAADDSYDLTPAMKRETNSDLWGYRHSLAYNIKSDVFYFVMDKYMFSLNLNHKDECVYDASNLCYIVNTYISNISYPIKRIACKSYKRHANDVWVKYESD